MLNLTKPRFSRLLSREDYAIRIDLRWRRPWRKMTPEQRITILQACNAALADYREQIQDEIAMLLDGAAGPVDMDAEIVREL